MPTVDRKKVPEAKLLGFLKNIQPECFRLSNEIPVYLINEGIQEVLRIEFVFNAGTFHQSSYQVAKATNALLTGGTHAHNAEEISEHFDFYGSYLETLNAKDNAYVCLYTLNKHLESTIPMLAELLTNPVFPEHELDIYRSTRKQHLSVNLHKVKYLARVYFNEQIFGSEHPYGVRLQPTHLDELHREQLLGHHKKHYRMEECVLVISGKIPPGLINLLEKYFGSFKTDASARQTVSKPAICPSSNRKISIKKNDARQSALRIGKPTINRLHPDFPSLFILNTILGGFFGSRLMKNIREDKGYTYGIGSALVSLQHAGMLVISSEVGENVLDAAVNEIFLEINKLRNELISEAELSLVKNYLLGAMMRSMDGPFAVAERLRSAIEFGQTMEYYKNYALTIREITSERILQLANLYLEEESFYQTIAGKV